MSRVLPRQIVPDLAVPTLSGTRWSVADAKPQRFSLIVFYRGLHCPICTTYIAELNKSDPEFNVTQSEIDIGIAGYPLPADNTVAAVLGMPFRKQRQYWRDAYGKEESERRDAGMRTRLAE